MHLNDSSSINRSFDIETLINKYQLSLLDRIIFYVSSPINANLQPESTFNHEELKGHQHGYEKYFNDQIDDEDKKWCSCVMDVLRKMI